MREKGGNIHAKKSPVQVSYLNATKKEKVESGKWAEKAREERECRKT